ncbi:hypothetical protein RFI_28620 [Reticulomyxa filosa]|uniref:Uncharacterized protein n=1 Tax=Reticulomyxa filosa TaxID=46433 RepID=X6M448_RETFI|nr:hypothetical protein RFI_28620 [Reticulomyxa filosa]|eukprot:ETO08768.1 hypothetical protein RFI_28620 [Reticulomyxa filosa]
MCYVKEQSWVVTGSWDTSIVFWDLRSSQRSLTIDNIKKKIFNLSHKNTLLVCTLDNKHFRWYDLRNVNQSMTDCMSAFQTQLRGLDCIPNEDGFAVGSVEGRIQIRYINKDVQDKRGFSFKCHRHESKSSHTTYSYKSESDIYSVNTLRFNQQFGTLASGGSDGELPVVAMDFNHTGRILAYATSYDYSRGYDRDALDKEKPNIYKQKICISDTNVLQTMFPFNFFFSFENAISSTFYIERLIFLKLPTLLYA